MRSRYQRAAGTMWTAVLVAALTAMPAVAQAPPGGQGVEKRYTNKTEFKLPITIDNNARATLKEVCLWVKTPTTFWECRDRVPPSQSGFTFRAPQDGEYWFNVVTIDKNNVATPADVSREAPAVIVVVDTLLPQFGLVPWRAPSGETCLRCLIQDANPDYQGGVKITWQGADQSWLSLDPYPGQPGVFRINHPNIMDGNVRVVVRDLAQNSCMRDVPVKEVMVVSPSGNTVTAPLNNPSQPLPPVSPNPILAASGQNIVQASHQTPVAMPEPPMKVYPPPPVSTEVKTQKAAVPSASAMTTHNGVPRQIMNTMHASIDYRIDQVGPSGVGKVDIWLTSDSGNSWKRWCEDHDRRSPAEIDLPGEGLFGLRLVVTNGNGFGGHAPVRGDTPTSWIEVDTTPPFVQLKDIEPVTNGSSIDIRWTVSDKNLAPEPVNLYYATRREGPWLPVARNLKNDGQHGWTFPKDQGAQFFIRLEAFDLAGNFSRCETPTPIQLDMTEPQAQVVGISSVSTPGTPQQGN